MDLTHMSASPHIRAKNTTSSIMLDVIIALLPTTLFGIYHFGMNALLLVFTCITSCVLSEYLFEKLLHKPITVSDYSAIVTGLLLALNLPSTLPLWIAVLGSVFAIVVVKQLYGGIGQNFMNPALGARCFLLISFTARMTNFAVDASSSATPLALLKSGESVQLLQMFLGNTLGTIGETSALCILIGALYLVIRKVITLEIPVVYICTFAVFLYVFSSHDFTYILCELCGGGLMLGAFFMATDYTTSPITFKGKIIYGVLLGILTGLFRVYGNNSEGVSYAIIISNLLVPIIEKNTLPTPFGKERKND